ncbi:hypothetical protein N7494_013152 [Penicillium frequentans]|uniref:Uncharacterized protein n=1 Tax=Penicillium frequentans TaxID=3151616 RepID=A0AAD6CJ82_9EURO|nr:hypothetical protein N7494_013152 [Penicillium glabrum]
MSEVDRPVDDGQTLLAEWDRRGRLSTRLPGTQGARDSSLSGVRMNSTIVGSSPPPAREHSEPSSEQIPTALTERQRVDEARRAHRARMADNTVPSHNQPRSTTEILGMDVNMIPSLSRPRGGRPSKQELAYRELFQQGLSKERIADELRKRQAEERERQRSTKTRVRHRPKAERRVPIPWTLPEILRLVPLWYKWGNRWAKIKELDLDPLEFSEPQLEQRTQVDLKDKMRQLTDWMKKLNIAVPVVFGQMVIEDEDLERLAARLV